MWNPGNHSRFPILWVPWNVTRFEMWHIMKEQVEVLHSLLSCLAWQLDPVIMCCLECINYIVDASHLTRLDAFTYFLAYACLLTAPHLTSKGLWAVPQVFRNSRDTGDMSEHVDMYELSLLLQREISQALCPHDISYLSPFSPAHVIVMVRWKFLKNHAFQIIPNISARF